MEPPRTFRFGIYDDDSVFVLGVDDAGGVWMAGRQLVSPGTAANRLAAMFTDDDLAAALRALEQQVGTLRNN